jgi:uncharacterized protein (DUF2461 family)
MQFEGFRPEGLELLMENRLRNDKAFYDAHKEQLKKLVLEPWYALCEAMTPTMQMIDPLFVTEPRRMVSRIRRDTRYTRDQSLYRDNLWLFFRRTRTEQEMIPSFYFEITQSYWGYGVYGCATPAEMQKAREMILADDVLFRQARKAADKSGFEMDGDLYKKDHFPDASPKLKDWLNRRALGLSRTHTDYAPLFDGSFVPDVLDDFTTLAPVYRFLCTARERARGERKAESGARR